MLSFPQRVISTKDHDVEGHPLFTAKAEVLFQIDKMERS